MSKKFKKEKFLKRSEIVSLSKNETALPSPQPLDYILVDNNILDNYKHLLREDLTEEEMKQAAELLKPQDGWEQFRQKLLEKIFLDTSISMCYYKMTGLSNEKAQKIAEQRTLLMIQRDPPPDFDKYKIEIFTDPDPLIRACLKL